MTVRMIKHNTFSSEINAVRPVIQDGSPKALAGALPFLDCAYSNLTLV